MNRLQARFTELTDADWAWWPFVHLRPAKDKRMTVGFVAKLALIYGTISALLVLVLIWSDGERDLVVLLSFALPTLPAFFVVYWFTFARWWNARAAQLREGKVASPAA